MKKVEYLMFILSFLLMIVRFWGKNCFIFYNLGLQLLCPQSFLGFRTWFIMVYYESNMFNNPLGMSCVYWLFYFSFYDVNINIIQRRIIDF